MCELLGISSRFPANATFSLEELSRHGGATGPHRDGWGVAFFEGRDVRLLREPLAAADSPCARFVRQRGLCSTIVISHVRQATRGRVSLANTQPFGRQLGGRMHVFAHNGDLPGLAGTPALPLRFHRPIGETDSEYAFCALLARLEPLWRCGAPSIEARVALVGAFAGVLRRLGPANFLYSDGDLLFAHGHRRNQGAGRGIQPPGLHLLGRTCPSGEEVLTAGGLTIASQAGGPQEVILAASVPLTDEAWSPMDEGELAVLHGGEVLCRA